jgi:hypothetical protein
LSIAFWQIFDQKEVEDMIRCYGGSWGKLQRGVEQEVGATQQLFFVAAARVFEKARALVCCAMRELPKGQGAASQNRMEQ